MKVNYVGEEEYYAHFWEVTDERVMVPVWTETALANAPHLSQEWNPATVGLFFSEKVAARVAELIKDDDQLKLLLENEE